MRIIAEIQREGFKITVFKHEEKVSVKFERDQMEYLHKFRVGAIVDDASSALRYIDSLFETDFLRRHEEAVEAQTMSIKMMLAKHKDEFPSIF